MLAASASLQFNDKPCLSVCMVTCDRSLAFKFIEHHREIFASTRMEVLVFCSSPDQEAIATRLATTRWRVRCIADRVRSGPSRKRNILLKEARGRSVMFLDDDSLFDGDKADWSRLMAYADGKSWVLFESIYTFEGGCERKPLVAFSPGQPGSGIEWNQLWPTELLRRIGAWPEAFCTGEQWKSGGALALAINCWHEGVRQAVGRGCRFSHPRQVYGNDPVSLSKGRRYRYAIGAVLAAYSQKLTVKGGGMWLLRLGVLAPVAAVPAFAKGHWAAGCIRLLTPYDAARGFLDYHRFGGDASSVSISSADSESMEPHKCDESTR